jgi:hypothetical protein
VTSHVRIAGDNKVSGGDVNRVRRTLVEQGVSFVSPGTPGRLFAPGLAPADAAPERRIPVAG